MFKNAILSIKKNIGRTVLLFLLMTLIANLIIAGLSIHSASIKSMQEVRASLGNDVTLSANMKNMMQNREKGEALTSAMPEITTTMADQLKELQYVEDYNYTIEVGATSDTLTAVEVEDQRMPKNGMNETEDTATTLNFRLSGNSSMALIANFTDETYTLSDGRLLTSSDAGKYNAVISKTLADDNDLSVGDTVSVTANDRTQELTIVGIFEVTTSEGMGGMGMNRESPYNTIYVDYDLAQQMSGSETNLTSATFYLDDPENIEAFQTLAEKETDIDFETYSLDANDQLYQRNVSTLENMESFATIFLVVVVIAGSIILCLILILTIRGRFYEIGIFMSMGQSKIKIIGQHFLEIVVIATLAFVLSLGTGKMVSNVIGNMLVDSNSSTQQMKPGSGEELQAPSDMSGESTDESSESTQAGPQGMDRAFQSPTNTELDVSLTLTNVMQLGGITILICILAVSLPAIYILRLTPREILIRKES